MLSKTKQMRLPLAVVMVLAAVSARHGYAHNGGILVQAQNGKLVTGLDSESTGQQTIGNRAFSLLFPSSLANDIPSFLSLTNAPAESEPLPAGGELYWDFLPLTANGVTSNLLYWDAQGSTIGEVDFGAVPQSDVTLSLYTQNFAGQADVRGTATMVTGKKIGTISNDNLALHAHRWFYLASETTVPEGIFLFSMQLRMEGYENSDPFYIAAATNDISASTLDNIALPWVESNIDSLIIDGDYDFDADVDGDDFLAWQSQYGESGPSSLGSTYADGNGDGIVDAADYTVWRDNFGSHASGGTGLASIQTTTTAIPEPSSAILVAVGSLVGISLRRMPHPHQ